MWSWEAICILKNTLLRSVLFCWDVDGKVVVKARNSPTERIKGPAFKAVFIVMCNMTTCLAFVDLFSLKDVHTHTHTHALFMLEHLGALIIASAIKARRLQVTDWRHPSRLDVITTLEKRGSYTCYILSIQILILQAK